MQHIIPVERVGTEESLESIGTTGSRAVGNSGVPYLPSVITRAAARSRVLQRPLVTHQMSPALDELSLQFAIWTRTATGDSLDIGCGDGIATAAALARGGHVLAVDPDRTSIRQLLSRIPSEQHPRVKVQVGSLPTIDFKLARFAAVHAARVLHFLDGTAVECSLRKFFRWLYPDGKLFISTLTPMGPFWEPFQPAFFRRTLAGAPWPGYIDDMSDFFPQYESGAASVHLLDERVLRRELEAAGFVIEEVSCYPLPWDSGQMCCAILASCGS
jgi:SAM-dependent methyltransferase